MGPHQITRSVSKPNTTWIYRIEKPNAALTVSLP